MVDQPVVPQADLVFEASESNTCATLTPKLKARMREMVSGGVLEVRTSDPTAREAVPAWCRLTGNDLIAQIDGETDDSRFFIRKK